MVKGAGGKKRDFIMRNVVLFPEDVAIVRGVMRELALNEKIGFSAALRYIIRGWAKAREANEELGMRN